MQLYLAGNSVTFDPILLPVPLRSELRGWLPVHSRSLDRQVPHLHCTVVGPAVSIRCSLVSGSQFRADVRFFFARSALFLSSQFLSDALTSHFCFASCLSSARSFASAFASFAASRFVSISSCLCCLFSSVSFCSLCTKATVKSH